MTKKIKPRKLLFLRDAFIYTLTAFGGPQGHLGSMLRSFVIKRSYVSQEELLELNALSQILPGPSSTQTLIGIAYKVGGLPLAIITFFIWILPSATIMCLIALTYTILNQKARVEHIMQFVQPITLGIVAFAAFNFARPILRDNTSIWLALSAVAVTLILQNAYVFPILILLGGILSSALVAPGEESNLRVKLFANINKTKIAYFIGILLVFAALGAIINQTSPFSLPIRLFENFYRNGIVAFGGGQVMVMLMFTEFVEVKHYLTSQEFLSGFAFQQAIPGPTFSFTSFVGATILKNAGYAAPGQVMGSVLAMLGINLPGMILILFIVPFWNDLKKITQIKNSLSGINAVSAGFLVANFFFIIKPAVLNPMSIGLMIGSFLILNFTKINTAFVMLGGVLIGYFLY